MRKTKDYGMVMRGLADAALESAFNADWIKLSSLDQRNVRQDYLEADEEDGCSVQEYRQRIGYGNLLQAYAEVLRVQKG